MNYNKQFLTVLLALVLSAASLFAQEFPADYKGKVIGKGEKPAWLPDGKNISYSYDNGFYIYEFKKEKAKKIADINIAEYVWFNDKTALVIAWPDNITERKNVQKIINYWLIEKSGKKHLLAADTSITNRIPDYHKPFRLPDGTYGLRKSPGWKIKNYVQNEEFVALTKDDYDLDTAIKNFRYISWSSQEGGSIHYRNIDRETEKTIVPDNYHTDVRMSQDYSRLLTYSGETSFILDSSGTVLFNLMDYIGSDSVAGLKKMFGGMWNNSSDGVAYYEIYDAPKKYYTLNYFNLQSGKKTVLTPSYYYSKEGLFFAPDDSVILTYFIQDDISYITLIGLPLQTTPADK